MTAIEILRAFQSRGIVIQVNGDKLRLDTPTGALTDDDRAALRAHKPDLLALLTRPDAIEAHTADGRLGRGLPASGQETPSLFELQPLVADTGPSVRASARPAPESTIERGPAVCPADVEAATFFDEILAAGAGFRIVNGCPVIGVPMSADPEMRAKVDALWAARTPEGREFRRLVREASAGVIVNFCGAAAGPRRIVIPQDRAPAGWKCPF